MSRALDTRLSRLEAQQPAGAPDIPTPYVHPLSPPSAAWWVELDALLETSPYRGEVLASLAGTEGGDSVCC